MKFVAASLTIFLAASLFGCTPAELVEEQKQRDFEASRAECIKSGGVFNSFRNEGLFGTTLRTECVGAREQK